MGDTQANQRKKTRGEDYIAQGSILAVAVVITKIIGVVYAFFIKSSDSSIKTCVGKDGCRTEAQCVPRIFMFPYICCFGRNYYISCDLSRSRSDFGTYDESAFQCLRT